jgi:CubicO group peptidase (beta-lactamase class C family)
LIYGGTDTAQCWYIGTREAIAGGLRGRNQYACATTAAIVKGLYLQSDPLSLKDNKPGEYLTMRRILFALLFLPNILSHAQAPRIQKETGNIFPDSTWQYAADTAIQGWDMEQLSALSEFIRDSASTTGMMVVQHGKVIFSYGDVKEVSYIASCRKSILSMLYGPFVKSGKIRLDRSLAQLNIDDVGGLLPVEKKATIRDLLTARSGVYHVASYQGDEYMIAPNRGTVMPGSFFLYNNWDFNLAGYVFEQETGVDIYKAIDSILAGPLKMEDWDIKIQEKEGNAEQSKYPAYPMWFSTRDMARIGYLMLRKGKWADKQVIPGDWVDTITAPFSSFKEIAGYRGADYTDFGYGYLWWVWDAPGTAAVYKGAYTAQGYYGQFITIIPALDLVIAHKTNDKYERPTLNYFRIVERLVAANKAYALQKPVAVSGKTKKRNIDQKILNRYVGEYLLPFGTDRMMNFFLDGDTLKLKTKWNVRPTHTTATSDTAFITAENTLFSFTGLRNGKCESLVITERGSTFTASRIHPSKKDGLYQYTGEYYNEDLQTRYIVAIKDHKLQIANASLADAYILNELDKDVFKAKRQIFRFNRSADSKKITGFSIETVGLGDRQFKLEKKGPE